MAGDLILLTGATGFLGYQVLVNALHAGYHVRCAIRSPKGIGRILSAPSMKNLAKDLLDHVSWIIVPDITSPGAYDKAVKEVRYIIHVASPVEIGPGTGAGDSMLKPAVSGAVGMLESAAAFGTKVERIVVTSSVVAILPGKCFAGEDLPPADRPFTAESRLPNMEPPFVKGEGYPASKIAALNASESWMKEHSPAFDLISLAPAWIWGRNELAKTREELAPGSNGVLLNVLKGYDSGASINSAVVSVKDTAEAHIKALSPSVPGNQCFIVGQLEDLQSVNELARDFSASAFESGLFSMERRQALVSIPMDTTKTSRVLGLEFGTLRDMVKEVVEQYLELPEH